jgi:hypothetical protein
LVGGGVFGAKSALTREQEADQAMQDLDPRRLTKGARLARRINKRK